MGIYTIKCIDFKLFEPNEFLSKYNKPKKLLKINSQNFFKINL